ncbi:thioredoxin family protein [Solemya velesiana gill symbiont]|uniref:thioredoxin family protein n=1 Tax=Solemya velesiana gill symbiont TaxID=1918948 RepID=UPI001FE6F9AA|nr:thioredoxin family protein [Solemya velesiana gill symbiont]
MPAVDFFDQSLGDFSEELEVAKEDGKRAILIIFEMDECPFCDRMKKTVLNQSEVHAYYKEHFKIYSVDIEGDVEIADFQGNPVSEKDFSAKQYRLRATPVFLFFDLQGKPIKRARFTGATNGPDEFILLGRYVVEGIYKQMSFTRFKRQQRSQ